MSALDCSILLCDVIDGGFRSGVLFFSLSLVLLIRPMFECTVRSFVLFQSLIINRHIFQQQTIHHVPGSPYIPTITTIDFRPKKWLECCVLARSCTFSTYVCMCALGTFIYLFCLCVFAPVSSLSQGIYSLTNSCFLNLFFCWCSVTGATNRKFLLFPLQKPTEFTYHSNIDVFAVCFNFQFICLEDFCITIRALFLCRTQRNLALYLCLCFFFIFLCGSLINYLI